MFYYCSNTKLKPSIINNFGHSCIKSLEITLNSRPVIDSPKYYNYKAYFLSSITFGSAAKASWMDSLVWYDDTPGCFDDVANIGVPLVPDHNSDNDGYNKRRNKFLKREGPDANKYIS